jgi:hypothetical protein
MLQALLIGTLASFPPLTMRLDVTQNFIKVSSAMHIWHADICADTRLCHAWY